MLLPAVLILLLLLCAVPRRGRPPRGYSDCVHDPQSKLLLLYSINLTSRFNSLEAVRVDDSSIWVALYYCNTLHA